MKQWLIFIAFLSSTFCGFSKSPQSMAVAGSHLREVNAEWNYHLELAPQLELSFEDDVARIGFHLEWVAKILRQQAPSSLSAAQRQNRLRLLDTLEAYATLKQFPQNTYHLERRPYFIDHRGVHCAVGYLMKASGYGYLAQQISLEQNYAYLKDIRTKGVAEWALTHGFALSELAWIQPGYMPTTPLTSVGSGTNGPVLTMAPDGYSTGFVFAGDFTVLDGSPCDGVGYYRSGALHCLPGLQGTVKQIVKESRAVIAVGEFFDGGNTYPIAIYDSTAWPGWYYETIPGREGATGTACLGSGTNRTMEVAITPPTSPGLQELWYLSSTEGWQRQLTVKGQINDIEAAFEGRAYAGHFDSVWVSRPAASDTLIIAHNLILGPTYRQGWRTAGSEISDTVWVVKSFGSALYLGGTCSADQEVCLTRYLNGTLQPMVMQSSFPYAYNQQASIQDLAFNYQGQESLMILGGEFSIRPHIGTRGKHLALFNLAFHWGEALAFLDGPVTGLFSDGENVYLGGFFGDDSTGHLAVIANASTSIHSATSPLVSLRPNPILTRSTVTGVPLDCSYQLMDMAGRTVTTGRLSGHEIDLSPVSSGMYVLQFTEGSPTPPLKVIKR